MIKLRLVFILLMLLASLGMAQEVGVRFGDIVGNNVAVDAVFGFKGHRIHADVSFGDGVGIEALSDFIVKPLEGEAFYYYIGAGVFTWLGDPFRLGVLGELGLEYRFNKVPIAIGLDWRPSFRIIDDTKFLFDRFGLNVRWVF
jgi:hypothetical protein